MATQTRNRAGSITKTLNDIECVFLDPRIRPLYLTACSQRSPYGGARLVRVTEQKRRQLLTSQQSPNQRQALKRHQWNVYCDIQTATPCGTQAIRFVQCHCESLV